MRLWFGIVIDKGSAADTSFETTQSKPQAYIRRIRSVKENSDAAVGNWRAGYH
jgi:hypothetical protein